METETGSSQAGAAIPTTENKTIFAILVAISVSHLLNDAIQSLIPAIYPVLKESFQLNFAQIGLITLTFQITASMLQPVVGVYTDHRPQPFSLAIGMGFSLVGLILLSAASSALSCPY
jgi:MFS transporter, FSR family, fosmidomycin resistance protein